MAVKTQYEKKFTALLTTEDHRMLLEIANEHGVSQTALMRQMIRRAYKHEFQQKPTCADGGSCRCVQQFTYPAKT